MADNEYSPGQIRGAIGMVFLTTGRDELNAMDAGEMSNRVINILTASSYLTNAELASARSMARTDYEVRNLVSTLAEYGISILREEIEQ